MNRQFVRILVLQALTLLLLALPFVAVGTYVWRKHVWAQSLLSELEPRHARLQGIKAVQPALELAGLKARTLLVGQAYPATLDATKAGNDAQQRIRAVFAESQLAVESIQVVEAKDSEHFQRIGVTLRVEGTLPNIQQALLRLRSQTPIILVDSFALQSTGAVKPASTQSLSGNFSFSVLRARQ